MLFCLCVPPPKVYLWVHHSRLNTLYNRNTNNCKIQIKVSFDGIIDVNFIVVGVTVMVLGENFWNNKWIDTRWCHKMKKKNLCFQIFDMFRTMTYFLYS